MKYLIDTHSLIWFLSGDSQLSVHARQIMEDEENEILVSMASLWEMSIKLSIGKLQLGRTFEEMFPPQLENNSIEVLDITIDHLKVVCSLPFHHRDPFDRLIIAQAQTEQIPVITSVAGLVAKSALGAKKRETRAKKRASYQYKSAIQ